MEKAAINPQDAFVLFADLQDGMANARLTLPRDAIAKGAVALAKLSKIFSLPVIVTTVPAPDGSPGRLISDVANIFGYPNAISRTTPDSLAFPAVEEAIVATGRRTMIVAGVATEVAVQLTSLTAASNGFHVHVVVDACAGLSVRTEEAAWRRMTAAGVTITSIPALAGELAQDFALPQGQAAMGVLFEMMRS